MKDKITLDTAIYAAVREMDADVNSLFENADISLPGRFSADKLMEFINEETKKQKRKIIWQKTGNYVLKAVSVFSVAFFLCFSPLLRVSAVRDVISETIIRTYKDHVTVEKLQGGDMVPLRIKDIEVGYMTEGFALEMENAENNYKSYTRDGDYITIYIVPENSWNKIGMDTEHSTFYNIEIDGNIGFLMCGDDGYNGLHILKNNINYTVSGYVNIDEVLKIYSNLEVILEQ